MMKQSPIFTKTYDLLLWLMPATTKFPREHRFVMARTVQTAALHFEEKLIEAGLGKGPARRLALAQADVELSILRFHLRLCRDLQLISLRQYQHVAEMVTEIGKLLGGWQGALG